ncbi:anti-sigma F factor [Christensenella sp. MSJ-20]|uniref:anti-sigma F factor n=1 Tax=Christensenella sp. MSJ-20 TaxID=2841518 RepID=UPI001C786CAC|nr:anti-sigma F factor [Christensenella sp. MSJ-20]
MEKNQMSLEFSALSQNESFARVAVGSFFVQLNPTLEELADVKTAVSEAVTNCIVHAYGEQGGVIRIECAMDGDTMEIRIVDYGVGIADVEKAMRPFYTSQPGEERSGMGFTVMQSFMDGLTVKSQLGRGTTVSMVKKVASAAAPAADEAADERENAAG